MFDKYIFDMQIAIKYIGLINFLCYSLLYFMQGTNMDGAAHEEADSVDPHFVSMDKTQLIKHI